MITTSIQPGQAGWGRWIEALLALVVFLIPWQARWIYLPRQLNGGFWEYGSLSLYATEAVLGAVLVSAAWVVVRTGRAGCIRPRLSQLYSARGLIVVGSGLLLAVSWLSWLWANDRSVALQAALRLSQALALMYLLLLMQPAARHAARAAFVVAAGLQGALAITQFFSQTVVGGTWLGVDPQTAGEIGASVVEMAEGRWLRAYGTFPHPNILAGFLALAVLLAGAWYVSQDRARPSSKISDRLNLTTGWLGQRAAALACGMLAAIGLTLTFSRGAAAALIAAGAGWGICAAKGERRALFRFFCGVALVGLLAAGTVFPLVALRLSGHGRLETKSLAERQSAEAQAWQLLRSFGWRGVGAGNGTVAAYQRDPAHGAWAYQPVHHVGLLAWLELGVAGLAALTLTLIGFLAHGISRRQGATVAVTIALAVIGFSDHYLWSLYPGLMFGVASLGIVAKSA